MQYSPHPPSLEAHVRAAWQKQVAAAVHTPGLLPELVRRHELLPRFAAYYTQLRALPRRCGGRCNSSGGCLWLV